MYYFPKRHFFNAPEYPAYPGEGAARSGSPVNLQPVNLKKADVSKFPQHVAPRQSYAVRAAAPVTAHAYRALVFENVSCRKFPKAQIMRPPVFQEAKGVLSVYSRCSLHCFFLCSRNIRNIRARRLAAVPAYPALPAYLNFSSKVSSKVSAVSSFLNATRALLTP